MPKAKDVKLNEVIATVGVKIKRDELRTALISAVEQYSSFWATFTSYNHVKGTVLVAEHHDTNDKTKWGKWHEVTLDTIALGMQRCADAAPDEGGWAFATWLKDRCGDAVMCDVFLQFAVLGEVKYG